MISFTESTGKIHNFSDNTLLVFIDDTGHEELSDKNFPIFGFGGCLIRVQEYPALVSSWKIVSDTFPSEMIPLHASELNPKQMTAIQKRKLAEFFSKNTFGRFAAITTNKAVIQSQFDLFNIMASLTYKRIIQVAQWFNFNQVIMIFEESKRTKLKMADYFSRYHFEENSQKIPTERFYATKKNNEAGLIIADFIAHTAGAGVMSKLRGKVSKSIERKDFELVFASVDTKYASFMEVTDGHDNQ